MSENLPNIDDLFRKALEGHDESPSLNVWANLDKNLDKKKVVSIAKKYRKLKWAAAALFIFSVGMAMYTVHTRIRNKELVRQNEINKKKVVKMPGTPPVGKNINTSDQTLAGIKQEKLNDETTGIADTNFSAANAIAEAGKNESDRVKDKTKHEQNYFADRNTVKSSSENKQPQSFNSASNLKADIIDASNSSGDKQIEKRSPRVIGTKSGVIVEDNQAVAKTDRSYEQVKRNVEIETVHHGEKNVEIKQPKLDLSENAMSKQPGIPKETTGKEANIAKNATVKLNFASKFSATAFYSPDFVSTRVHNDRPHFREDDRNEIKKKEKISQASTKGILINYNTGNNWSIQSGLVFSTLTTDILPKTIFARPDNRGNINYRFNCSAGYTFVSLKSAAANPAVGDSILALSSRNTLQYFGIPIGLSYTFSGRKFSLAPGVGITANFLTSGSIETSLASLVGAEKKRIERIEGIGSSYLNGSLSLAANYYVTKHLALSFTPVARLGLVAINKDAPVKTYLNSYGLAAGLTVRF